MRMKYMRQTEVNDVYRCEVCGEFNQVPRGCDVPYCNNEACPENMPLIGTVFKEVGRMATADNWIDIIEKLNIKDDEVVFVYDPKTNTYQKYDNQMLAEYYEDKAREREHKEYYEVAQ